MQGLICYKPVEQESCFLRKMDKSDYEHVHALLQESTQKVSAWQHVSSGAFCFFCFCKKRPSPFLRSGYLRSKTPGQKRKFALKALPSVSSFI